MLFSTTSGSRQMFHKGIRTAGGGNASSEVNKSIESLLDQFLEVVTRKVTALGLLRAVVRSMLSCSIVNVLDREHLFVAAQKHIGMPDTVSIHHSDKVFTLDQIFESARWEFGFDDPFVVQFPAVLLSQPAAAREAAIEVIADEHIRAERTRVERENNMVQVRPIWGPAAYPVDSRLAFVLMPFTNELTAIYSTFIKPTIEDPSFGLVCRRADDIKSNSAIMQDIWKSICEARLIVADLSGLNPNVMYELGIAHTVGKETVLIYQTGEDVKFPFDLAHIRRIEYTNDALGGKKLVDELKATLQSVLLPSVAR
jgi:hypothetical protein